MVEIKTFLLQICDFLDFLSSFDYTDSTPQSKLAISKLFFAIFEFFFNGKYSMVPEVNVLLLEKINWMNGLGCTWS